MSASIRGFEKTHLVGTSRHCHVSGFDFTGATLTFCGYMGSADHRKATCSPCWWRKIGNQDVADASKRRDEKVCVRVEDRWKFNFFRIQIILSLELLTRPCQCHPWEASHVYHHEAWPIALVSRNESFGYFSISSFAICEVGRAVLHLGSRRHGADDIESGTRMNLIVWYEA